MRKDITPKSPWRLAIAGIALWASAFLAQGSRPVHAQALNVGSDGSDGALVVGDNQVILFDPADAARWGKVLDPDGDGVYHFTTITIGPGGVLKLRADKVNKPVFFLASGPIVINGTIDLDGEAFRGTGQLVLRRSLPIPGSGGYAGGAGGLLGGVAPTAGEGPGGGTGGVTSGNSACTVNQVCGHGGTFTGNRYLVPPVGGSGGEGARWVAGSSYYSGGAGGGALLIASSTSIAVNGAIVARGGPAGPGGGGSGGSIRVVAPTISGGGSFYVDGGSANGYPVTVWGGWGWVRLEGFTISSTFGFSPNASVVTRGAPVDVTTLKPSGSLRVSAIAGIAIPIYPSGSFVVPDVAINSATPVNVEIQATGIPPGTTVTLRVYPDTPDDLSIVNLPEVTTTLQGTLQQSTATVPFSFPYGYSRGYVRATWTQ